MRSKLIIIATLFSFAVVFSACGGGTDNAANTTNTKANSNAPVTNSNDGIVTNKKADAPTTNDAPTFKPVVVAYYDALKKKDEAGLKAVLSAELIKSIQEDMKSEKKTKFADFVAETDKVPENGIEVRNEKINGDKGLAEVKGGTYLTWTPLAFVREGGVWKLSNESPDVESVTKGNK